MTAPPGYHGQAWVIDLGCGTLDREPLTEAHLREYLGGAGLAVRLLHRHAPAGVDALSPDNPLIITASPFIDCGLPTDSRTAIAAKSPLTGLIGDSLLSGDLGVAVKRLGCDALVLRGGCARLSVLVLDGERVRLLPAQGLEGRSPASTEALLHRQLGPGFAVAAVGAAGEAGVRFAALSQGGSHAVRTGLGAVCGIKGLKALAVRGRVRVSVAHPARLRSAAAALAERTGSATEAERKARTAERLSEFNARGLLPTRTFQAAVFPSLESGTADEPTGVPFESLFALGPLLGIAPVAAVRALAHACDRYGLDTISAGGTLAWAMESAERGAPLPRGLMETGLRFGAAGVALRGLRNLSRKRGPWALLAEGCRRAAAESGTGTDAWALHVKGLELPGYEPRVLKALALALAVSPRGACHNRSSAYDLDLAPGGPPADAAAIAAGVVAAEDRAVVLDSLTVGKFLRRSIRDLYDEGAQLLHLITGWDLNAEDLRSVGPRVSLLRKCYNLREGWSRADDTLPDRLLTEPVSGGPHDGACLTASELDAIIAAYYQSRGWNADGTPQAGKRLSSEP